MGNIFVLACASEGLFRLNDFCDLLSNLNFKVYLLLTPNAKEFVHKRNIKLKYKLESPFDLSKILEDYFIVYPLTYSTLHKIYYKLPDNFELSLLFLSKAKKILFLKMCEQLLKDINKKVYRELSKNYLLVNKFEFSKQSLERILFGN